MFQRDATLAYQPAYWLAALGAGGLAVSFFMYLMWMLPHVGVPMPTWEHLVAGWQAGGALQALIVFALSGVVLLSLLHFVLLIWNIRQYRTTAGQQAIQALRNTSGEVQLMAMPLTLSMTVNVLFILGALFVPGLWGYVEYLFPAALLAYLTLGVSAVRTYGRYLSRIFVEGGLQSEERNHLSPLMAVFAFSMLSVGFAAPAGISGVKLVSVLAATLSILFLVLAVAAAVLVLISSISAIMRHGLNPQASPSLLMLIPILTLLAIEWVRLQHGLSQHFAGGANSSVIFVTLTAVYMFQIAVLLFGLRVMRLNGYLREHLSGRERSPVSFGLICPGVAIVVMGMFWWHLAWVNGGVIQQFGVAYWIGIGVLATIQLVTLLALFALSRNMLLRKSAPARTNAA